MSAKNKQETKAWGGKRSGAGRPGKSVLEKSLGDLTGFVPGYPMALLEALTGEEGPVHALAVIGSILESSTREYLIKSGRVDLVESVDVVRGEMVKGVEEGS